MYIAPNTTIKILKNCPLDNTYDHTIYFANASAQQAYFSGLTKYTLNNHSYQRVNSGVIRVQVQSENLYDCNYIMFQNSSFGNKWFYAFITSVEYVNNETSEIRYEDDVMQTWFFDYTLEECFVEREHSATDNFGENIVPESVETGDYIVAEQTNDIRIKFDTIVVATSEWVKGSWQEGQTAVFEPASGAIYSGIYSGCKYVTYPMTSAGISGLNGLLNALTLDGKPDAIVSIFLMPSVFIKSANTDTPETIYYHCTTFSNSLGSYTPRNKKLLTYPYNYLAVSNNQGGVAEYKYEFCQNPADITFEISCDTSCSASMLLTPQLYGTKSTNGVSFTWENSLPLGDFPMCSWNIDSFKAWLAQNAGTLAVSTIATVAGAGIGVHRAAQQLGVSQTLTNAYDQNHRVWGARTYANDMNYIMSGRDSLEAGLYGVSSTLATVYDKSKMPAQAYQTKGSGLMCGKGIMNYQFMHKCITPQFARIIDDFFDMFGYATHRLKVPNRNVRPHWTYTKTISCAIVGSCPADVMRNICAIYDHGITFWKNGNEIGNYSLDNRV